MPTEGLKGLDGADKRPGGLGRRRQRAWMEPVEGLEALDDADGWPGGLCWGRWSREKALLGLSAVARGLMQANDGGWWL